jgi:PTH1 family peptidyl-tRNA hydrolase
VKLIAGLGNPGRSYNRHRHNVGFMVVDALAARHEIGVEKKSFGALIGSGAAAGESVILAKPQKYMNLSGVPVAMLLRYYKLDADSLIVVHDDLDIECGRIKLMRSAGPGGHNGISSIIDELGHKDFIRVRVGVGRPPENVDGADYVLAPISKDQKEAMGRAIEDAADAVELIIEKGLEAAQHKYHS